MRRARIILACRGSLPPRGEKGEGQEGHPPQAREERKYGGCGGWEGLLAERQFLPATGSSGRRLGLRFFLSMFVFLSLTCLTF